MYLLFDVGGTKMRLAVVKDLPANPSREDFAADAVRIVATPSSVSELVAVFRAAAADLLGGESPTAICGGVTRKYEQAKPEIAKLFAGPSFLENDAALAALGEARVGAGQGATIVAYFTVSTGVGGARVVNGKIDEKMIGFEPGQQIINVTGEVKTLESLISGRSLAQKFGRPPKEVAEPAVWDELAKFLALGLHNSIVHWSPEVVVLGGSMILGDPAIDLAAAEAYLKELLTIFPAQPALRRATLGDFSGLHGALHFLQEKLRG